MLDAAEEAFHQVAVFVKVLIEGTLDDAIAFGRDDRLNIVRVEMRDDHVSIVGFVRAQRVGQQIVQQGQCLRAVTGLAASETEAGERPQAFNQGVNLGAQSAPRSPERLVTVFFGAPAAC